MTATPVDPVNTNSVPDDGTQIWDLNQRAWTGVTTLHQNHTETLQNARATQQAAYDLAQGSNGTARDSAALARIELDVASRANHQYGVHTAPAA